MFTPQWKAVKAAGTGALAQVVAATDTPVLALGGITPERVEACLAAGARGVAVASGIVAARDIAAALHAYAAALAIVEV